MERTTKDRAKVAVAGCGYVGLSLAVLLARVGHVTAYDIDGCRIETIARGISPIEDAEISDCLASKDLDLHPTASPAEAYAGVDYAIIAVPTDYDAQRHHFDVSAVEAAYREIRAHNDSCLIVIKSTVPIGFTEGFAERMGDSAVVFSPEFLRESRALYDNLYPSRLIVGLPVKDPQTIAKAEAFLRLLADAAEDENVPVLRMHSTEAEAVKLFSNTYLAMRVAFFNELDTFAAVKDLDAAKIIDGVGLDPRIGTHYNNPSFGYGGYCLPKDTKQLAQNYRDVPNEIITAVVQANSTRKSFIADTVHAKALASARERGAAEPTVGIYRLIMKSGSDNFRQSSIFGVIERLEEAGTQILVYEPELRGEPLPVGCAIVATLDELAERSDVIIANRYSVALEPYREKVYTRDIYGRD